MRGKSIAEKTDESGREEEFARLDAFYKATGVGVFRVNLQVEIVGCAPPSRMPNGALFLSMSRAALFLRELYAQADGEAAPKRYYTFATDSNFFCNIVPLYREGAVEGALLTEPVRADRLSEEEMENLLRRADMTQGDRRDFERILPQVPVVPWERFMPIGGFLCALGGSFFAQAAKQVLQREKPEPQPDAQRRRMPRQREFSAPPRRSYPAFLKLKETIRNGDVTALLGEMQKIDAGSLFTENIGGDFIRSVKNRFIESCALGCYAAVDGNASYERMMALADDSIRRAETLCNVYDIYEQLKSVLAAFARAASLSGAPYSKPVKQVMEYIERNYAEKVTLARLGAYTGLSTFYLSSLIRKETGLILTDNVNKTRVEKSKALLRDLNISVLEAAQRVGFTHQNHYAAVFKKFTGVTPTEFRRSLGLTAAAETGRLPGGALSVAYEQALSVVKLFPNLYDAVRIVDPIGHRSWLVNDREEVPVPQTCYRFWRRSQSCENCVSRSAYLLGGTAFKIECADGAPFLVLAVPKTIGKDTFVVELLVKLGGERPLPGDGPEQEYAPAEETPKALKI